jgi:putative peptidoglycan lipid II flippase
VQPVSALQRVRSRAFRNSLIVMGGFGLSRLSGLLRDIIASYFFGTSAEIAAYRAAFSIVDLLYLLFIGGALGSSFIPIFIQVWERDGDESAWNLASAVLTWALLVLAVASALIFVAAPWLVTTVYGGQGFDPPTLDLMRDLIRLFLCSPLLLGMGGLAMAALNARDRFLLPALAPSIYNLGIILGALAAPWLGIWGMAWGVIGGALLYVLVQVPGLRAIGMRLRPTLGRQIAEVGRVARQMGPRVIGQAAAHVSIVVTLALAARLPDGDAKLAGLSYAYQLMLLPYGVFSLSLSQVAFPRLARLVAEERFAELRADLRSTLGIILWLTLPAVAGLLVLGFPGARVLFERGEYGAASLQYTTTALLGYAAALPAFAASEIMIRGFYALQRTWIPVLVGLLQVSLNLALGSWFLRNGAGLAALALTFSVANTIEALLLAFLFERILPGIWRAWSLWRTLLASAVASLGLGLLWMWWRRVAATFTPGLWPESAYAWRTDLPGLLVWLLLAGVVGVLLYLAVSAILGALPARAAFDRVQNYRASRR